MLALLPRRVYKVRVEEISMLEATIERPSVSLVDANYQQLELLGRVITMVSAHYDVEVAARFLRTSCPFIGDRSPLEVIASEEPTRAQEIAATAVLGFLDTEPVSY